ncbi:type II pantothenate kinase [Bacillus salacetis]|uniref:Type II pantothenate kinase n=1 Tax=Bacillus salacetis TaxID=2315464 RepID=A0A3A1QNY9_9BACI|nr:type II pantothenate kinase [Bacillus salacetis]RIW28772.1 type II pantothenate kinase [Bacillus salacetis]
MNRIGIDAGGTLTKVVYFERDTRHHRFFQTSDLDGLGKWINWLSPDSEYYVTGGKAGVLKNILANSTLVPEFEAVCSGSAYLVSEEHQINRPFILANIGTGTSFFYVDWKNNEYRRLMGTGLGGGTILGLGRILTGLDSFEEIISLAATGKREKVDLLVRDLYEHEEPPIPGYLTAANFAGKRTGDETPNDSLRALINMAAENTVLLAARAAEAEGINTIVFTGGALTGNTLLRSDLSQFRNLMDYEPVFLENGAFAGAVGCILNS